MDIVFSVKIICTYVKLYGYKTGYMGKKNDWVMGWGKHTYPCPIPLPSCYGLCPLTFLLAVAFFDTAERRFL